MNLRLRSASSHPTGRPFPLGAQLDNKGCNFAVYSPRATGVTLCFFDSDGAATEEIVMAARSGNVWHIYLSDIKAGQAYGYRTQGPFQPEQRLYFAPEKLLIDPYANALSRPVEYHPSFNTLADHEVLTRDRRNSGPFMAKSLVVDHQNFDWDDDTHPYTPWTQTVIYETHIKGISQLHPEVPDAERGTYLGMTHPAIIKHLKDLGVTAVQLMPIQASMPEPRLQSLKLTNYWGYNTVNWFAPDPRYASEDAVTEFKQLVRALHQAGIEVILDVVYNHTAEGDLFGTTLSQRGLFAEQCYRYGHDGTRYVNDSGCGNTVNLFDTSLLQLVMDSLRHWVRTYHVDGFRFDLAATLGREARHFSPHSAFFKAIAQDPILNRVKLIAEPWDIGPNGYQLGQFPDTWHECNDRYRDTVRGFWRGDAGLLPDFCTRLMGSRDLLQKGERAYSTSLNFITYHDGFTLHDLVSYEARHNEANLENNRDGHGHNLSINFGHEGGTNDRAINILRQRQKRNLLATLLLSQGAVHLLGGDEIGRTQQGNNNAYCQDNEINWYDWENSDQDLYQFVQTLISLRQSSNLFHDLVFTTDELQDGPAHNDAVHWFNNQGKPMAISDWHNPECRTVGLLLSSSVADIRTELAACDECFLWLINAADTDKDIVLPTSNVTGWQLIIDTARTHHEETSLPLENQYVLGARSMALFSRTDA
ncbi:MAG: glycogen debranching protein GlgX [Natronospirillum sp.]